MVNGINTTLLLFCPCHGCKFYGLYDNKITKDGTYTTKNDNVKRQMFYCDRGKHRFFRNMLFRLVRKTRIV